MNAKLESTKRSIETLFAEALGIDPSRVSDALAYNSIKEWDSVAHMALIAMLEDHYAIMIETEDVIDLSSVGKAKEILAKYGVLAG
jgi:acyl carrier protein